MYIVCECPNNSLPRQELEATLGWNPTNCTYGYTFCCCKFIKGNAENEISTADLTISGFLGGVIAGPLLKIHLISVPL